MRLDGYVRVSRIGGREGEGYISPDLQREAIEGKAKELGGEVVAWHDDSDYSGGSIERPGFEAVLERLRAGDTDGLVVKRVDRFSRDVPDGAALIREIGEGGGLFAACDEAIELGPDDDRMMVHIHLTIAQDYLDKIKRGWIVAKDRAVERGAHIGPTPIGYRREEGRLSPDPHFAPAITALFTQAATGRHGDTALARWMTERAPRDGGREWQPSEIRRWLANRVYLGEVHYGDLVNTEAHEPLTDPETWERCQREPGVQRLSSSPFLLTGLVRCAHCRYSMGGQTHGGSGQTPVYRCTNSCESASVIVAERLEAHVTGVVVDQLAGLRLEAAENGIDLALLDREHEEAESELQTFAADVNARRLLGEAGWQEGLAARAADRDAKLEARDDSYSRSKLRETAALDVDSLDHEALHDLLTGMIRCVFVRRRPHGASASDRALVVWSDDPGDLDLPGPHRGGPFEPIEW